MNILGAINLLHFHRLAQVIEGYSRDQMTTAQLSIPPLALQNDSPSINPVVQLSVLTSLPSSHSSSASTYSLPHFASTSRTTTCSP
jgi:hypothetical protein